MKRDMDLIRELLLKIADADKPIAFSKMVPGRKERDKDYEIAAYHMQMLIEAGLVRAIDASTNDGKEWLNLELTWHGHDFLESIRDPTVWENTKDGAKKLGGVSLDVLVSLAKAYLKAEAKKRLGIEL